MPRIARNSFKTSFFHVIVQGINKEYIFDKDEYIQKYLSLMDKYKEDYEISILAYCIMNNHAHLLIYTENVVEMTGFMHKINGIYAQYYNKCENRVGVVFRNRYESEPIFNERYLAQCIRYIHMNPVRAKMVESCGKYKYSTYNEYVNNMGHAKHPILINILGNDFTKWITKESDSIAFKDIDVNKDDIIKEAINEFLRENDSNLQHVIYNRKTAYELIMFLKNNYRISYTEMTKPLGLTRWQIMYIIRNNF